MNNLSRAASEYEHTMEIICKAIALCASGKARARIEGLRKDGVQFAARADLLIIGLAWFGGCQTIDRLATGGKTYGDWSFIRDSDEADIDRMREAALRWLAE